MSLLTMELQKIYGKRNTLILVALIGFLNVCLLFAAAPPGGVRKEDLKYAYSHLGSMTKEERIPSILNRREELISGSSAKPVFGLFRETEHAVLEELYEQTKQIEGYPEFLREIQERSVGSEISIFQNTSEYSKENALKTARDFKPLEGIELKFVNSRVVTEATQNTAGDLFAILLLFLLVVQQTVYELDRGLYTLMRTTSRGRAGLISAKLMTVFLTALMVTLLLGGTTLAGTVLKYGSIDWGAPIQSVIGYGGSALKLSIGEYLLLYYLSKCIAYWWIGLLLLTITLFAKKTLTIYLSALSILGMSLAFYFGIDGSSPLKLLHYINPVPFTMITPIYRYYFNLNLFGQPVNIIVIFAAVLTLGLALLHGICILHFIKGYGFSGIVRGKLYRPKQRTEHSQSLLMHESYKLFIAQKGGLLLIALIVSLVYLYGNKEVQKGPYEAYYAKYMQRLEGFWTAEKTAFVHEENQKFNDLIRLKRQARLKLNTGEITPVEMSNTDQMVQENMRPYPSFRRAMSRVEHVKAEYERNGRVLPIVYEIGYLRLLGLSEREYEEDMIGALLLVLSMVGMMTGFYTMEYDTGMIGLIRSTPEGKERLETLKLRICLVLTGFLLMIIQLPETVFVLRQFGLEQQWAPAAALPEIPHGIAGMPLIVRILAVFAVRFLTGVVTLYLIRAVAFRVRKTVVAQAILMGMLGLPIAFHLIGLRGVDFLTLNPYFSGNMLWNRMPVAAAGFLLLTPLIVLWQARSIRE